MEKLQCSNGHWYDKSMGYCPQCRGGTKLLDRVGTKRIDTKKVSKSKPSNNLWLKGLIFLSLVISAFIIIFYEILFHKDTIPNITKEVNITTNIVEENTSIAIDKKSVIEENNISSTILKEDNSTTKESNSSTVLKKDDATTKDSNTTAITTKSKRVVDNNSSILTPTVVEKSDKSDFLLDIKKSLETKSTIDLEKHRYNFVGDK